MHKLKIIIALLLASNALFFFLYITSSSDGRESFGDKKEWSILQSLEYCNRNKPPAQIKFEEQDGYKIVYVPSPSGNGVWVMLNPKNPPYYKQMPQIEYSLTPQQYSEIKNAGHVSSTVDICLQSHTKTQKDKYDSR